MNAELERIQGLERQRALLIKAINALRTSLALEDDPIRKLRYEEQLLEKEGELLRVEDELQQAFGINTLTGQSVLAGKIEKLGIGRELGVIDLVNCSREQQVDQFWKFYEDLEEHRFQFYFLTSCDTQKAGSFAERMLYEYLIEELDEAADAIYYRRDPKKQELGRPLIEPLPRGRNLEKSQHAFRKYFADFWSFSEQQSFEEYLQTGLPRSEYDAVALFFRLDATRWKEDVTLPYLEWMIDTLQSAHADVPRVLVFLTVNFTGAHLAPEKLANNVAYNGIKSVLTQHPGVAHLLPFSPVPQMDVERWFRDLNTWHTALIGDLMEAFRRGLGKNEQQLHQQKQQFNMDDIEMLQWEVFKVVNRHKSSKTENL
jgi:hypothetical protein